MNKILYIVLGGLGDLPLKELNNKTPLEAAMTPYLDRLAQSGKTGLVRPLSKEIAPESDIAVISLLGYDVEKYFTGRGPLEAFAEGLSITKGNLALRVNFATAEDDGLTIKDRRVGRDLSIEEAAALAKEINSKITLTNSTFEFKNTVGHRGVLVIRGIRSQLSAWITNTDPAYGRLGLFGVVKEGFPNRLQESLPMPGYENSAACLESAQALNEFTRKAFQVLGESAVNKKRTENGKLAANVILARDAGDCLPELPAINTFYKDIKFGCFVQMPVERGVALLSGLEIVDVPSSTGHLDVDYSVWAKIALEALKKLDCIYIHIKGPDEAGHDGDCLKKKEVIEIIDKFFLGGLIPNIDLRQTVVCVTSSHCTVSSLKAHSSDPVPLLVAGGAIKPDGSLSFSEKSASQGLLGELKGQDILPLLVKYARE